MLVNIEKRKTNVSDQVLRGVDKKLAKLEKFFPDEAVADVKFSEVRGISVVEVTIRSSHMYFRAEDKSGDPFAALDNSIDAIVRQIKKHKTKLEKRLRDGAFDRTVATTSVAADGFEGMIRRKRFELKPMTEEEAVMQMELLNHQFYLFKNSEADNRICVVYTRNDGGYGIIEAE